jgi:O-antigen/teichoic acid export membrane protein
MENNLITLPFLNSTNIRLRRVLTLSPEVTWVFVGQAGTAVAGLVGVKLLTRILDPSEFGQLAIASTIIALIGTNCFGPISQGLMRFWAIARSRGNLHVFSSVANYMAKTVTLIVLIATLISALLLSVIIDSHWTILVTLSLLVGAATGFFSLRLGIFTAARQRRRVAILSISNTFIKPLMATFLIVLTVSSANVALFSYLLVGLFFLFVAEYLFLHSDQETLTHRTEANLGTVLFKGLKKEILSYSWPFLIWGIFGWVHMSCDRWSLQVFHGSQVVGSFAVVSLLATYPLNFGSAFLTTLFSPIAFQRAGDLINNSAVRSGIRILKFMTLIYIAGAALLTGFFTLFHRPLIILISNKTFATYSSLLPGLTIAWAFFFLGQMLVQFGLLSNRPQVYILPKLTASLVAATTTFYFSAKIGPSGVVWGLAIAGIIYAAWCTVVNLRLTLFLNKNGRCGEQL